MRLLFLGDIVGRAGRELALSSLSSLRKELGADFIIVNVENAAGGFGVTPAIASDFFTAGADVLTTGNRVWDKREIIDYIEKESRLLRPYNMAEGTPGLGYKIVSNDLGQRLCVINLICNLFMSAYDNVFMALDNILHKIRLGREADFIFIDVHGEATSEKTALGFAADGLVSAVIGTHTHVPTADARILPKGTAYQTDSGMCGDYTSVIGMEVSGALNRFKSKDGGHLKAAKRDATLCGTLIDIDDKTGLATAIKPYRTGGVLIPSS